MFAYPTYRNINDPSMFAKFPTTTKAEPVSTVRNDGSFVKGNYKEYDNVETTIKHWELRDLIRCPRKHMVLRPVNDSIRMYNTKTGQDTTVFPDMSFEPNSVDMRYRCIAAAGRRGKAIIQNTETGWSFEFSGGRGINNSIHLSKINHEVCVTICNNDQSVNVYAVPSMEKRHSFQMPSPINQATTSPDGTKLLMVGDNGKGYLFDTSDYRKLAEMQVSEEAALTCTWHPSSSMFAIATQDGFVCVWSVFGLEQPLCKIGSVETRKTRKAVRSIQFSNGPLDLLAYTEHVSVINIVDTRTFQTRQIIRIQPTDRDHHITGVSFSPDSSKLLVGLENSLVELEMNVSGRRQFGNAANLV